MVTSSDKSCPISRECIVVDDDFSWLYFRKRRMRINNVELLLSMITFSLCMGRHFDVHKICLFTYYVERKHSDRTIKSHCKALRDNTNSHVAQTCWIIILKYIDSPKIITNKPVTDCTDYDRVNRAGLRSDADLKKKHIPYIGHISTLWCFPIMTTVKLLV